MSALHVFEKYEVLRRLAQGGMGDIFLARQTGVAGFNRLVVLKSLKRQLATKAEFLAQFLNEARMSARISHPNVVSVYEVDEWRGVYFLAMEHIKGADLASVIDEAAARRQRIPFRFAAAAVHDAALGLHHAHSALDETGRPLEIVHRDISPHNVMVRLDGITKVVDFGIAAAREQLEGDPDRIQGKIAYMSPEQMRGERLDGRSDQFSLGVVLYELLTGQLPFGRDTPHEIYGRAQLGRMQPPSELVPDLPRELEAITRRMLSPQPDARFPTLLEVALALAPIRDAKPGIEQQLGRFVTALFGKQVQEALQDLTPQPVEIEGLLEAAELPCPSCGEQNALRSRHCRGCGASLFESAPKLSPARASRASVSATRASRASVFDAPAPVAPRSRIGATLRDHAAGIGALMLEEIRRVVVVAAELRSVAGHLDEDRRAARLRAMHELTAEHRASVLGLTAETVRVAFGADGPRRDETHRALAFAEALLARTSEGGGVEVSIALASGDLTIRSGSRTRPAAEGPALSEAETLAARARAARVHGIFLTRTLERTLDRRVKLETLTVSLGGRPSDAILVRFAGHRASEPTSAHDLIGRNEALTRASEHLKLAFRGEGRLLVFTSDPGMGKTRLLREIERQARDQGALAVFIDGGSSETKARGGLLAAALRGGIEGLTPLSPEADRLEDKAALLGLTPPATRAFLAALSSAPAEEESPEAHLRVRAALGHALLALADMAPLCLLVDDFHLLPEGTFAELMGRLAGGTRIAVIAAGDVGVAPPPDAEVLPLEPLEDEKILALLKRELGGSVPLAARRILLERADGSPALALALARTLIELGGLVLRPDGSCVAHPSLTELELPHRLEGLVALRIERLSRPARDFIRVAALAGSPFDPGLVSAALGRDLDPEVVGVCVSQGLLAAVGEHQLRFREAQVRRAILERVSEADAKKVFRRLARVLEETASPDDANARMAIATYLVKARAGRRAAVAAIEAAGRTFARGRALELYRAAAEAVLEDPVDPPRETLEALITRGLPRLADASLDEALPLTERLEPRLDPALSAALSAVRADVLRRLGRLGEAEAEIDRGLEERGRAIPPALRAERLATKAAILEAGGRVAEAAPLLTRALELAETTELEDVHFYWRQSNALGRLAFKGGDLARARSLFELAASEAKRVESHLGQAQALTNLAAVQGSSGDRAAATEAFATARALALESGDALTLAKVAYNEGRLAWTGGDTEAARAAFEDARRWAREVGWSEGEALALEAIEGLSRRGTR